MSRPSKCAGRRTISSTAPWLARSAAHSRRSTPTPTAGRLCSPPRAARFAPGRISPAASRPAASPRSEEHTSELQSRRDLVCRLLLEKKKILVSERVIPHVLNDATAIGEGLGLAEIFFGRVGVSLFQQRLDLFLLFFFFNDTATTEIYTFPYTTLFRSSEALAHPPKPRIHRVLRQASALCNFIDARSEEHTSELQSRRDLVCRLLLE